MTSAPAVLAALGGAGNVVELEPCITRLRVRVNDPDIVDVGALEALGAHGVRRTGNEMQIVLGPSAEDVSDALAALLPTGVSEPGGLDPLPADANSPAANILLGVTAIDEAEQATGE